MLACQTRTRLFKRPFRAKAFPNVVGCHLYQEFDGAGLTTAAMAKAMVSQALSRWLARRIAVEQLEVNGVNEKLEIDLTYRIAGQADSRRVRFQRGGG